MPASTADPARSFLRHTLATLAYRAEKPLRDAPPRFESVRAGETTRTAGEILAHLGDLLEWALWHAKGQHVWKPAPPQPWAREVERFYAAIKALDNYLASDLPLNGAPEKIFQGPIADALTHVGQLATLRRLAGSPVRGENYFRAEITPGRVGADQSGTRVEFD
jgi:hypothetical protein